MHDGGAAVAAQGPWGPELPQGSSNVTMTSYVSDFTRRYLGPGTRLSHHSSYGSPDTDYVDSLGMFAHSLGMFARSLVDEDFTKDSGIWEVDRPWSELSNAPELMSLRPRDSKISRSELIYPVEKSLFKKVTGPPWGLGARSASPGAVERAYSRVSTATGFEVIAKRA